MFLCKTYPVQKRLCLGQFVEKSCVNPVGPVSRRSFHRPLLNLLLLRQYSKFKTIVAAFVFTAESVSRSQTKSRLRLSLWSTTCLQLLLNLLLSTAAYCSRLSSPLQLLVNRFSSFVAFSMFVFNN